ncbi:subunit of the Arp2/3 complex [Rhodotorula toruloides]
MPAYNASAADLDGARLVGNFPLLPFRSSIRGPAAQPGEWLVGLDWHAEGRESGRRRPPHCWR